MTKRTTTTREMASFLVSIARHHEVPEHEIESWCSDREIAHQADRVLSVNEPDLTASEMQRIRDVVMTMVG
jgi:hypothetical protein